MTKDKWQPGSVWGTENKSWWKKRTELERKLLIGLSFAVFLIVGFLVYVAIQRKGLSATSDTCTTPGCLLAASQIITHIDPDVDPCDDFFKFACGKFIEHIHGDLKAASIQAQKDQVQRQLNEIMDEPINEDDHGVINSHKRFYQTCMNETAVDEGAMDIFNDLVEELNGWPVVAGFKWKEEEFNWKEALYKLRRRGIPLEMLLSVEPVADPDNTDRTILQISNPYVKTIKAEHKDLYKTYMTDVAVIFGANRARAVKDMEKVLDFMENLDKISDKNALWAVADKETDFNYTAELLTNKFKVDDFHGYDAEIDWLDFLSNLMFPIANISGNDYVIFPKAEFLDGFFDLLYNTPKRTQADYIIWTIVDILINYFPKELKELEENYACLTKEASPPKDRSEYCRKVVAVSFHHLQPAHILFARRYLPPGKREKLKEMSANIKTEFTKLLHETSWIDDASRARLIEKADAVAEVIGAPGNYFDDEVFENFPEFIDEDQDNNSTGFVKMLLNHFKKRQDYEFSLVHVESTNITEDLLYYDIITKVNAMYLSALNTMFLPAGILQGIFYSEDRPMYLNYGTLGSIIGHELTHSVCKDASIYDKDGNEAKMWSEETEKAYDEVTQCMIQDAEDFDVEDTDNTINGTITLEENIADFAGVKVSYAAYKNWVKANGEESGLPGIDYTPYQLFWISTISYECYKLSGEKLEKGLENNVHALNAFRATAPMRNNKDFARDFRCPVDSKMNPSVKCQVF